MHLTKNNEVCQAINHAVYYLGLLYSNLQPEKDFKVVVISVGPHSNKWTQENGPGAFIGTPSKIDGF